MKYKNVKEILELLLVKKNNFSIVNEEQELLNELQVLLLLANNNTIDVKLECKCELDNDTIEEEVEINQCLDCGLPLSIL
jgi:hypothetical protein